MTNSSSGPADITLQQTGSVPITIRADLVGSCEQSLTSDKRGIVLKIYREVGGQLFAVAEYRTQWETEFNRTWVFSADTLESLAQQLSNHAEAPGYMPPGSGFPAMPQYEARQLKLQGVFQSLSLHAITVALQQAHQRSV